MSFITLFGVPLAFILSLTTNHIHQDLAAILNQSATLTHLDDEHNIENWTILNANLVDLEEGEKTAGYLIGTTVENETTCYYLNEDVKLLNNNIKISGNVTLCLNGNVLEGTGNGSVISVLSGSTFTLDDCKYGNEEYAHEYYVEDYLYKFDNAKTAEGLVYGGVLTGGNVTSGIGGGAVYTLGTFIMEAGIIAGNSSSALGGGAIYVIYSTSSFTMNNGAIMGNFSSNYGGAIDTLFSGPITMNGGTISNNYSGGDGGGIYLYGGCELIMTGGSIENNTAVRNGGGIYGLGSITFEDGSISNNSASDGDGIYIHRNGELKMSGGYLDNIALQDGYNEDNVSITGGYISQQVFETIENTTCIPDDYVAVFIHDYGTDDYDEDYVEGFDYAVYKEGVAPSYGTTFEFDILDDAVSCLDNDHEGEIVTYVSYSSYTYSVEGYQQDEMPNEEGSHEVQITFYDVMVEVDGEKFYYEEITTTFTITINALHTPMDEFFIENEVEASCLDDATYDKVTYCSICDDEVSRETVTVDVALGHTAAESFIIENEVAATETTDGSYDEVIYCTVCGEELTRTSIIVPATGDTTDNGLTIIITGIIVATLILLAVVTIIIGVSKERKKEV